MTQAVIASPNLTPADLPTAFRLAEMMANASLVPKHLQGKPADCLLVIEQASRWGMSPFAVAQATSVIGGKLMYEGKLVAAALNSSGALSDRLAYAFTGSGDTRVVTVTGTIRGEKTARSATIILRDVRTANDVWKRQPDQQLVYSGARVWARRHLPEVMLGVYTPDEFDEPQVRSEALPPPATPPAEAADGATEMEKWLEKIITAEDIEELGQVSQEIHRAKLGDHVLAQLRAAFIRRKVQLTPTTQPPPVATPEDEIDPETGELLVPMEAQGAPPASEEPAPASETAPSGVVTPAATDTPHVARSRGFVAFRDGASRKAIPGPYRGTPLQLPWLDGWAQAEAEAKAEKA
jgi:ribosome modulation factor